MGYEPYIVVPRNTTAMYDERFTGYGMNKVSHIYELDARGFKFVVLPDVFIISPQHPPSEWSQQHNVTIQFSPI